MNKQPAFCGKQPNTHFTVKRQTMLTLVSNSKNLGSASPSFQLSVCVQNVFFSLRVERTLNTRLEMIENNRSARRPMPLHKKTPQGQARWLQQRIVFSDAPASNTARIHLLFLLQKDLHTPTSLARLKEVGTVHNFTTAAPSTERERIGRKATLQCN